MKSLRLFIASIAVTCFSLFPAFAQADELDEPAEIRCTVNFQATGDII